MFLTRVYCWVDSLCRFYGLRRFSRYNSWLIRNVLIVRQIYKNNYTKSFQSALRNFRFWRSWFHFKRRSFRHEESCCPFEDNNSKMKKSLFSERQIVINDRVPIWTKLYRVRVNPYRYFYYMNLILPSQTFLPSLPQTRPSDLRKTGASEWLIFWRS